jgi:DNA-binding FadR family transcriptional regulator
VSVRAPKAAVRLAQRIVGEIRRRGLAAGDKLISEERMVARYGVARGTLREALRYLELQGVLRIKSGPGGGPVVARPDAGHLARGLALVLEFAGAPLRALFEARSAIEPGMAAWAARRASEEQLAGLRASLDRQRIHLDDADVFREEVGRFHDGLAAASGNPVFSFLMPALRRIGEGATRALDAGDRRRVLRAHRALLAAVESREPDEAARILESLGRARLEWLERSQARALDRPVSWSDAGRPEAGR